MPSLTPTASDAGSSARPGVGDCSHRMRVVGGVQQGTETRLDCQRPLRAVCLDCGEVQHWRCDSYGCEHCGELKRRRLARLVDNGAGIHLENGLLGYFVTLTAPGVRDHRRWRQGKQRGPRPVCDCHLHGKTDGWWNGDESANWNRLRTALTRDRTVVFCGAVETQQRDLLHRHVLLFTDRVLTFDELQTRALAAGYGCVVDVEPVRSADKAARYISKYVTKSSGQRAVVPWERLDPETGELVGSRATYRLWSSSRAWGVTMREIKATQSAQARARALYVRELGELLASDAASAAVSTPDGTSIDSPDPPPN